MSLAVQVWTTAGALASASAAALLWRGPNRAEPAARRACRWLAAAAGLWGCGLIAQDALGLPQVGATFPLTFADLLALLALPPLVTGVAMLAADRAPEGRPVPGGPRTADGPGVLGRLADASLLALALFIIGWLGLFAADYGTSGVAPGGFALDLVRPLADLIALGVILAPAVRAGRPGLLAGLALLALTAGDALAVGARASGAQVGGWPLAAWVAGLCLLGAVPLAWHDGRDLAGPGLRRPAGQAWAGAGLATVIAAGAAVAAALALAGRALAGGSGIAPVAAVAGAAAVLVLIAQVAGLLRRAGQASEVWTESVRQLRELAGRTSDVVLVCELDGTIRYASSGVAEFGYSAEQLKGLALAELVHPEDRAEVVRAALAAAGGEGQQPGRYPCRVRSGDGTWRHVETTISRYREAGAADRLLVTARDLSDEIALRRQVTHLTFHDGLTGLPNRMYLEERVKSIVGPPARLGRGAGEVPAETGAIFLDLDGFTAVNDSVGHGAGDLLLAQAARRLRVSVPPQDTVARWGGDEFAILVESATSAQEVVDIAERLAGAIAAEPFRAADRDIPLTASIGVALASGEGSGHLLRNADVAMSRAKGSGGGRVEVFASHMHADVMRRLELASDLRVAITQGQLAIEYQPVVRLADSRIVAVEALVRWTRVACPVPREEFLGVAEDSGLIVPLGARVLREACRQVAGWRASGWEVGLAVNISLRQLSASAFTETVLAAVADSGLPPDALTIEVAERVLIEAAEPIAAGLAELRRLGVRLAIDDFGTGYASLAYLRRLAVDIIKIDPSFVAGLGQDATLAMLTRTIVGVGHDLGIEVVAEGIERPEQLELLKAMGCGLGQGYLVARPMPASGVAALVGPASGGAEVAGAARPGSALPGSALPGPAPGLDDAAGQLGSPDAPAPAPAG